MQCKLYLPDAIQSISTRLSQKKQCLTLWMCGSDSSIRQRRVGRQQQHVVVCLPRPMEGMGRLQFSDLFSQNCQFHHRRLESLEHLMCLIYILLSTTVSHFLTLRMPFFFTRSLFYIIFYCIHFHFASTLCMCVMYLTSI